MLHIQDQGWPTMPQEISARLVSDAGPIYVSHIGSSLSLHVFIVILYHQMNDNATFMGSW